MLTCLYNPQLKAKWDAFVRDSRNATFLFERDFMDYHKDRFEDCSLVFMNDKNAVVGLLPANANAANGCIDSHGGLTYGGLILGKGTSLLTVKEMLVEAAACYLRMGYEVMHYKPTPYIYHTNPSQEDLYWLFRAEATLDARAVSTTVDLLQTLPFSTLRKRKVKKAVAENLQIAEDGEEHWSQYWQILTDVLAEQHQTRPVHTLEEILRLKAAFPESIRLFTVHDDSQCLAGCVLFDCGQVVHVQYIAGSPLGKSCGALDFLFSQLIQQHQGTSARYFDFGISTERGGTYLNEGLLFQKEGFGGRAVCYDCYTIDLNKLSRL